MSIHRSKKIWIAAGIVFVSVAVWYFCGRRPPAYSQLPLSFDGSTDQLQQTAVLPTLDSPIPAGKSAIWCVSIQLAWNVLKDDVVKEPIRIANAQTVADRLNVAGQGEDDLDADHVYAAAGLVRDGLIERIQREMARKFPNSPRPELDSAAGAVAYGYLQVASQFDLPYFENDEPFKFTDSSGTQTDVTSFGIREKDDYAYGRLRDQIEVLYYPQDAIWGSEEIPEFILDLHKTSQPYQLIIARIDRRATLADTVREAERLIASGVPDRWPGTDFHSGGVVLVPNMAFQIVHRFSELEGRDKQFLNPALKGFHMDLAMQTIRFRLDRSGTELTSESKVVVKSGPSYFYVNRPYLLYLKKRRGERPIFAMWVDSAELLQKWRGLSRGE